MAQATSIETTLRSGVNYQFVGTVVYTTVRAQGGVISLPGGHTINVVQGSEEVHRFFDNKGSYYSYYQQR